MLAALRKTDTEKMQDLFRDANITTSAFEYLNTFSNVVVSDNITLAVIGMIENGMIFEYILNNIVHEMKILKNIAVGIDAIDKEKPVVVIISAPSSSPIRYIYAVENVTRVFTKDGVRLEKRTLYFGDTHYEGVKKNVEGEVRGIFTCSHRITH